MHTFTRSIAPSLLSADFAAFGNAVRMIEESGADIVHLDMMDGNFVPNLTFGPKLVGDLRKLTSLPLDVHLMVNHPESYIDSLAEYGADYVTFHIEAGVHSHRTVQEIHDAGMAPGISLVPSTPVAAIAEILRDIELVLVMSVNPGFGGQRLIPSCLEKITTLKKLREEMGYTYSISVDGGASLETRALFWDAGADIIVSGSSFFAASDKTEFIKRMKA